VKKIIVKNKEKISKFSKNLKSIFKKYFKWQLLTIILGLIILVLAIFLTLYHQQQDQLDTQIVEAQVNQSQLADQLADTKIELEALINEDQFQRNETLEATISSIEKTYGDAVDLYEEMLDLEVASKKNDYSQLFAQSLNYLSKQNYASASTTLNELEKGLASEREKISTSFTIAESVPVQDTPPSSGYSRQRVNTDIGDFLVDIVTADLNSTRVIVDTASDSDCQDNCPVLPLADYVARSGAYAGVNGSYFCPADYPSCAGKTNSFDTLAMNKNKKYLNSDNNVYSTIPAVIFHGSSARFVGASQEWGRDTGVDAVLANYPLLVSSGNIVFTGNDVAKQSSKSNRSFVGASGSTAYIGVVHNATVAEVAKVLHKMGVQNALNLDAGGSAALWSGGYKVGPGRNLPNVILFVKK
jgi:exopolysaccharide biosynthesis protein